MLMTSEPIETKTSTKTFHHPLRAEVRPLTSLAIPLIAGSMSFTLYGLINSFFLGPLGEVILVGHSFGASTLLKYLSEERLKSPVAGLFLIATPYWGSEDWQKEYALEENFAPRLPENLKIFFYHSRDDDVVLFKHLRLYKEKLPQATFLELERGGHQFNSDLSIVAHDIQTL
jgi:Serine hydrolase